MKSIVLKKYATTLPKLIAVFICLIVSNCQIRSQSLPSKDSLVLITKVAAERRLIELKDYRVTKQLINQYQITDSIQKEVIKNDSIKTALDKKEIALTDSLYKSEKVVSADNKQKYLLANSEIDVQKKSKRISWIVSGILAVLLIIK